MDDDYVKKCASSALEVFNFITNQGHSGCSIEITKSILFDLLNEHPLTYIQGLDNEWVWAYNKEGSCKKGVYDYILKKKYTKQRHENCPLKEIF